MLIGGCSEWRCLEMVVWSSGQPTMNISVIGGVLSSSRYSSIFLDLGKLENVWIVMQLVLILLHYWEWVEEEIEIHWICFSVSLDFDFCLGDEFVRSAVEQNGGSGLVSEGNVKCGCDRVSCDCDENWPNWARSGPDNLVQSN